jgi:hypothetical protein
MDMEAIKEYTIVTAALTPIIGLTTVYIAIQQYKAARRKLKLDLYDRRYKVYEALMRFLKEVVVSGGDVIIAQRQFLIDTNESAFLFGKEVNSYLELILQGCRNKWLYDYRLSKRDLPADYERLKMADEEAELIKWLSEQLNQAKEIFGKYISLEKL